ncbi:hypothetical protein [uncultured Microscilla sp.]|uniref:hypothetical protein n=1 Tax=uncultured Microscilla sp. TaxID=432653 RepID=UPI002631C902|nr:hypothetical protein [uncultured Microscilla sp.]
MNILYGLILIALGILASPSLLLSRRPDAKEILDKIAPYQGWLGLIFCAWGIWSIIKTFLFIGLLKYHALWWFTWLAGGITEAVLGFILGYATINKLVLSNSEEAQEKGERLIARLRPIQGKLGVIGIVLGVWMIVARLLFY